MRILKALLFALFIVQCAFAQERTITGTVLAPDRAPLSGVTVQVKGTARQTSTKDDGKYSITVSPRDVLVYTSVGYVEQERVISSEDKTVNKIGRASWRE